MGEGYVMGFTLRISSLSLALALGNLRGTCNRSDRGADGSGGADKRAAKDPTGLEEIVVTAEKRESTVQKTPISMTAIRGAELQARACPTSAEVAQEIRASRIKTSGPGQTAFEMRGLTATGGARRRWASMWTMPRSPRLPWRRRARWSSTRPCTIVNRVEVLRGPQGTLYGAGSMGGTIKLVTNQPELQHVGNVRRDHGFRTPTVAASIAPETPC